MQHSPLGDGTLVRTQEENLYLNLTPIDASSIQNATTWAFVNQIWVKTKSSRVLTNKQIPTKQATQQPTSQPTKETTNQPITNQRTNLLSDLS